MHGKDLDTLFFGLRNSEKDGGYHDFDAVQEYLYNALPIFLDGE